MPLKEVRGYTEIKHLIWLDPKQCEATLNTNNIYKGPQGVHVLQQMALVLYGHRV